jgi:hypothetical protein
MEFSSAGRAKIYPFQFSWVDTTLREKIFNRFQNTFFGANNFSALLAPFEFNPQLVMKMFLISRRQFIPRH